MLRHSNIKTTLGIHNRWSRQLAAKERYLNILLYDMPIQMRNEIGMENGPEADESFLSR
jgi:hypothetical protein